MAAGDLDGHDRALGQILDKLAAANDVVVLAQASMARVLPGLAEEMRGKFLSSPRLGVGAVVRALDEVGSKRTEERDQW